MVHKIVNISDFLKYTKSEGECLVWTGFRYPKTQYGQCYFGYSGKRSKQRGKYIGAHRLRWILERGEIPHGMLIMHICDNPPCVRLDHLRLGTTKDNQQDMSKKGRSWRGSKHHKATTDENTVRRIREAFALTPRRYGSIAALARQFGLTFSATYQIVSGSTWRHIL